jgi:hypothetical protein
MIRASLIGLFVCAVAAISISVRADNVPKPVNPATPGATTAPGADAPKEKPRSISQRLADQIDPVKIENASARQAFNWWSTVSGIPLVINWEIMAKDGIDQAKTINMDLRAVPAGELLALLMTQVQTEQQPLMFEKTPWFVRVITKAEANRHPVVRVYDVGDLVQDIPDFIPAGGFDLQSAIGNRNNANGSAPLGNGIVGPGKPVDAPIKTTAQKGEELAKMVRETIEPKLWADNGGTVCTIRYFQGKLIVSAPLYIQEQIGIPVVKMKDEALAGDGP